MDRLLKEIEVADNGQGKCKAWWKPFAFLDPIFGKEIQEKKEQNVVVEWDFHGWICMHDA